MLPSYFRNIIMTSGIISHEVQMTTAGIMTPAGLMTFEELMMRGFPWPLADFGQGSFRNRSFYVSSTVIASSSHTSTQLSQPRHSSAFTGCDFSSTISKTSVGQTSTHSSQPTHFASSTVGTKAIFHASFNNVQSWCQAPFLNQRKWHYTNSFFESRLVLTIHGNIFIDIPDQCIRLHGGVPVTGDLPLNKPGK